MSVNFWIKWPAQKCTPGIDIWRYGTLPYINMWNAHNLHTHIGIRKIRNWFRYETFIYLFEIKVFRHEEKETQYLTMLTVRTSSALNSLTQPTHGTFRRPQLVSPRRAPKINPPRLSPNLNSLLFFKSPNPQPIATGHDVFHIPQSHYYLGFLLSHPPRPRVNTCTQRVHLTKPCTKSKGSQPN